MAMRLVMSYGSIAAATLIAAGVLTVCGPAEAAPVASTHHVAKHSQHAELGRVTAIQPITSEARTTGAGVALGAIAGGVIGHQIGSGTGNKLATVAGATGGAVLGNQIERNHRQKQVVGYRVTVRADNGKARVFESTNLAGLKVGDRVRVDGGQLRRA
jgi:outer membrane lipoprotein SlyB